MWKGTQCFDNDVFLHCSLCFTVNNSEKHHYKSIGYSVKERWIVLLEGGPARFPLSCQAAQSNSMPAPFWPRSLKLGPLSTKSTTRKSVGTQSEKPKIVLADLVLQKKIKMFQKIDPMLRTNGGSRGVWGAEPPSKPLHHHFVANKIKNHN